MAPANNTLRPSIPSHADIERRRRELLAWQAAHKAPSPASSDDEPGHEDPVLEEVNRLAEYLESLQAPENPQQDEAPQASAQPHHAEYLSSSSTAPEPPALAETALYGLAGLVVRSLAAHTEADPAAILLQFLAAFGNILGPALHCTVGATRHGLNLFVVLVGESSKARKGTSWRQIASLFTEVDPLWVARRTTTARPTPYAIINPLRDQDPPTDRRLLLLAEEFASVLHMLGQRTGQLSPLLRCAWDGGDLSASNGTQLLHATNAHLSIVAHITESELAQHLTRIESHNGFANRCLWTSVRRGQSLPEGGSLPPDRLSALAHELRRTLNWAQTPTEILFRRTEAARELWTDRYPGLSQGRQDAYGAATSRAEAQVLRLSALYAALDCSGQVEASHLHAALAVWDYCQASARLFFSGDPIDPIARRISEAISDSAPGGLSKWQISGVFHGHVSKERIDLALQQLTALGIIGCNQPPATGRGRPATIWAPAGAAKETGRGN
jgi:hypothetical protein